MELEGVSEKLDSTRQSEWENITSDHVFTFYQKYNDVGPGVIPVNVSSVNTTIRKQSFYNGVLEIEYNQTIVLGRYRPAEDEDLIFVTPFEENSQDYVISLMTAWDLNYVLVVQSVMVGQETLAPTSMPSSPASLRPTKESEIGTGALTGISVSIVLGACLVVGFLFWSKKSKRDRQAADRRDRLNNFLHEGAQTSSEEERHDLNNNGPRLHSPIRPRNVFGGTSTLSFPGTVQTASMRTDEITNRTSDSRQFDSINTNGEHLTSIPANNSSHHHRHQQNRNHSNRGNIPAIPMLRPNFFSRNHARTESEITDSDGGGPGSDGSSDYGFIVEPPVLASITDNSFRCVLTQILSLPCFPQNISHLRVVRLSAFPSRAPHPQGHFHHSTYPMKRNMVVMPFVHQVHKCWGWRATVAHRRKYFYQEKLHFASKLFETIFLYMIWFAIAVCKTLPCRFKNWNE